MKGLIYHSNLLLSPTLLFHVTAMLQWLILKYFIHSGDVLVCIFRPWERARQGSGGGSE